ncbi:hypothetical protein BASA50_009482 [Batrachochytrium salamandrivorans]|uniref:Protein PET100, mitochondrial n=1 Tax=Batrachochytrium salamandrivorans TaxID=1357716 RepID=A0ABQ8F135_9FUNG|nr:hypothetical protein BASA62_009026 [Batrachochytrium salamandrivorans]KAH6564451.1 hypothetical protein BASA60_010320 [Batrachochytrium salamandrivorans]KAH6590220.1 hypothetical protein BASA50_009482 [Batrachochytrium salamandrivorans]KAH6602556.1 hypothetical protein BASA61_001013 [Batrachochytrium salamandrivorans]KAH9275153.1 hypothetical protein BASA83_002377 [Batrachochytrium salamandrivorans]
MPPINVNLEVFKFGLYIMFPVGVLYVYNKPEIMSYFPSTQDDMHLERKENQKIMFNPPTSRDEVLTQMAIMRRNLELKKAAAAAAEKSQGHNKEP